jgi:hypothetical protein
MLKPIAQPGTVRQIEYQLIHLIGVQSRPSGSRTIEIRDGGA